MAQSIDPGTPRVCVLSKLRYFSEGPSADLGSKMRVWKHFGTQGIIKTVPWSDIFDIKANVSFTDRRAPKCGAAVSRRKASSIKDIVRRQNILGIVQILQKW